MLIPKAKMRTRRTESIELRHLRLDKVGGGCRWLLDICKKSRLGVIVWNVALMPKIDKEERYREFKC